MKIPRLLALLAKEMADLRQNPAVFLPAALTVVNLALSTQGRWSLLFGTGPLAFAAVSAEEFVEGLRPSEEPRRAITVSFRAAPGHAGFFLPFRQSVGITLPEDLSFEVGPLAVSAQGTAGSVMLTLSSEARVEGAATLEPMPPKLVPTSMPASARKNRALARSAMMAMRSAVQLNRRPVAKVGTRAAATHVAAKTR